MATVSCARPQGHKAQDRCAHCVTRCAELDDLNLHVKSRLAIDLASRFGGRELALPATEGALLSPNVARLII
jgi:hypothetical protein